MAEKMLMYLVRFSDKAKPGELAFPGKKINDFIRSEKRAYVVFCNGKPIFKKVCKG